MIVIAANCLVDIQCSDEDVMGNLTQLCVLVEILDDTNSGSL